MSWVSKRPTLSVEQAAELAESLYAIDGTASPLDGERDQNFKIDAANQQFVLKVSNPLEDRAVLELQHAALRRLHADEVEGVPAVILSRDGRELVETETEEGHLVVRMLSWLPGKALAEVRPHSDLLLERLGDLLARLDDSLAEMEHPEADRHLYWDLQHASTVVGERLHFVVDAARRERIRGHLNRFAMALDRHGSGLRKQIIQGDANDWNVLVNVREAQEPLISGLIDFGDMVRSWRVAEPAIAMAYVMLDKACPLRSAAALVRAYHQRSPLNDDEVAMLWELALMRLCASVTIAAEQRQAQPDNDYLGITEKAAWDFLEQHGSISPAFAHYTLRDACGWEAHPESGAVLSWLSAQPCHPLLGEPLSDAAVVDLSVASAVISPALDDPQRMQREIDRLLEDQNARVGIGRYDEPRLCYRDARFEEAGCERRTVHLGVDLFAPAGTQIHAPLPATVVSLADNAGAGDYGPTVILEHQMDDGGCFFSLYGHLSRETLNELAIGQSLTPGEGFACLGTSEDNGGWPTHVHVQVFVERLGFEGDFPGVANPNERSVWRSLCPNPAALVGLGDEAVATAGRDPSAILRSRQRHLGPNLSVSYQQPLKIVRGRGAYLYDEEGREYLDCVNNVCHVGHAHPRVVAAAQRQLATLNTNTRYLHDHLSHYAERLASLFPDPLNVCFFVCSGSEANELALRLARAYSGGVDVVCLDAAYHGNTEQLVGISPYKHDGPGGQGTPEHVHVAPLPDGYRGKFRQGDGDLGELYGAEVEALFHDLNTAGRRGAAFIAESIPGCGGQVVLPEGYLEKAYRAAREHGAVCIADEVQVGFGRVGEHWWAFEEQGVIPDIVTMGKPIGNGHPMGAVITTPEIAAAFATGMEYFNTFGGNPVSCAVGLSVLDVIEEEGLRHNAVARGEQLRAGFEKTRERCALIGDVRGRGLFLGVELVLDRAARTPAPRHARWVAERMRQEGVLVSTDGPDHNVIKLKPPLAFSNEDANWLLRIFEQVVLESALRIDS